MEAIVLAGGLGTRLRPVLADVPKPLALVAGRPFLAWQLDMLAAQGVQRVLLATGYRADQIRDTLGTQWRGMKLEYLAEPKPLGTGGALRDALLHMSDRSVLALNGDSYLAIDLAAMCSAHNAVGARVSMAVCRVPDASRFGTVEMDGGRITAFLASGSPGPGLINGGTYVVERQLLADAPPGGFSFERDFLQPRIATLRPAVFLVDGPFIDIGTPEDYARAQHVFGHQIS
jgi:D-glycero-alpha-D-manno-heptose 1-phosphate guanylyltransferase